MTSSKDIETFAKQQRKFNCSAPWMSHLATGKLSNIPIKQIYRGCKTEKCVLHVNLDIYFREHITHAHE